MAPQTSKGMGGTVSFAVSLASRMRPTWGPLPWTTAISYPRRLISAICSQVFFTTSS